MLTISQIENLFHRFNGQYFNRKLPNVTIKYCCAKGYTGIFDPRKNKYGLHTIKISKYFDMDDYSIENTLIHEMIHLWQYVNGYQDIHGESFKRMMNTINSCGIHKISVTDKNRYNVLNGKDKYWQIIVFKHYGQNCICKVNNIESLYKFYKQLTKLNSVTDITMHKAKHEFLDKITSSCKKLNCYHISSHFLNTEIIPNYSTTYEFQ